MSDSVSLGPSRIETEKDLDRGDAGIWEYYMGQDKLAEKQVRTWHQRSRKIIERYRDERPQSASAIHKFNILWSNVQTLLPTLYARTPKPDVQRRFKDQDDTGRLASTLLERCISYSLDHCEFDAVMQSVVLDRLLPGRGIARVLYVPHYGDVLPQNDEEAAEEEGATDYTEADAQGTEVDNPGDAGNGEVAVEKTQNAEPLREVVYEEVTCKYVFWEDYQEGPARTWEEVPWVRYRSYMTRDELIERFGSKIGKEVNLDFPKHDSKDDQRNKKDEPPPDLYKKARVHEYWDRAKRRVVWLAPGTPEVVLDQVDDPLGLPDFFPSPDPLCATMTTDKRIPVPDFIEYQDQASELDKLTMRIDILTQALKVSGIYPGEHKQVLQQLVDAGTENRLIPVQDWQAFAGQGGLQQFIQFMPIKEVAETLIQLYDARDKTKQILYEITGIGDIMRGETQPMETATAQQLKSNFVTRRILPQQRRVARFARDLIRLMGGVIAEHFSAQTISQITGYPQLAPVPQLPPPPPQWRPAPVQHPALGAPAVGGAPPGAPASHPVVPAPEQNAAPHAEIATHGAQIAAAAAAHTAQAVQDAEARAQEAQAQAEQAAQRAGMALQAAQAATAMVEEMRRMLVEGQASVQQAHEVGRVAADRNDVSVAAFQSMSSAFHELSGEIGKMIAELARPKRVRIERSANGEMTGAVSEVE